MRFWRMRTGAFCSTIEAIVVAPTREAALEAVKADEPMYRDSWDHDGVEVEEVTPAPGKVLLWSVFEG